MDACVNFAPSEDRDRFIRLTRLLIAGGTPILREVLRTYHNPTTLAINLQSTRINFTKPQKQLVFPPPGILPDFDKFDISLIFKLLRNCCGLTEPVTKWNELPAENDVTREADIVRIDFCRNEIHAHTQEHMALTQADFLKYWDIIAGALYRIATTILTGSDTTLRDKIQELRYSSLTIEDRRTVGEYLQNIEISLARHDKKLDNIEAKEDQLREGIEGIQDTLLGTFQSSVKISDDKPPAAAAPAFQYNVLTINQFSPNISREPYAQGRQPSLPQGIRRQVSEGTITHSSPQLVRPSSRSYSMPSNFQHKRRSSQEQRANPEDQSQFLPQNHRADEYPQHAWQSPNQTTSPGPHQHTASFYVDEFDPLANQAAAPRTRTTLSNHDFSTYYDTSTSSTDRQAVNTLVSNDPDHEWMRQQQQQQQDQDPFLRIKISLHGAGSSDVHLGDVLESVLNASNEGANESQFFSYLENHQLIIKAVERNRNGNCYFIKVSPRDFESLESLWRDFTYKDLREFVKETVLPEDYRGEVNVDINSEEYKKCCERLTPREFKDSGRQLHSQSFSQVGMDKPSETITRSMSVMDLSSYMEKASQELFKFICKHGGRMDWEMAIHHLSYYSSIELTALKQNMTRYLEFLPNNAVQVKVSLKFCPKMRKDNTCNDPYCSDLHLCIYYFLWGGCQFGFPKNTCKNSHDISDYHTNNVFTKANLSFLNDEQRKQFIVNVAYVSPEICFYYNRPFKPCTKGSNCPCLHVCKKWVLAGRVCGAGCQLAHTFRNQHEQTILKKNNLDQLSDKGIIEKLKGVGLTVR